MNSQAFDILEFDSLRRLVRRNATTQMAGAQIDRLTPFAGIEELQIALRRVGEMLAARQKGVRLSFAGVADPTEAIARLKIEGTALDPLTIVDLAGLGDRALDAWAAIIGEQDACPTLFSIVAPLRTDLARLTASLKSKILPI